MSSTLSLYEWYLRGHVECMAKVAVPTLPSGDYEAVLAAALGWRHATKSQDILQKAQVDRAIADLLKQP